MKFIALIVIVATLITGFVTTFSNLNILDYTAPIITFIIGVVTIFSNFHFNKKNNETIKELKAIELNANIIANARINWLESVRNHTADFIKNTYSFKNEIVLNNNSENFKEADENFKKSYFLLKLYFTENRNSEEKNVEHKQIIDASVKIYEHIYTEAEYVIQRGGEFNQVELNALLNSFTTMTSDYFKEVWEEAKNI